MRFNDHYRLKDAHAFLSPSNYHWINYDEEKLVSRYTNHMEAARGTALHSYAQMAISLGIRQARSNKTLNAYINDAIGYRMETEQVLFYSENCFGTADAISFKKNLLRIHDLKNGVTKANMAQLRVYNAIFCLEYEYSPHEIEAELRIYQMDEVVVEEPDPYEIQDIMIKIREFDTIIKQLKEVGQ